MLYVNLFCNLCTALPLVFCTLYVYLMCVLCISLVFSLIELSCGGTSQGTGYDVFLLCRIKTIFLPRKTVLLIDQILVTQDLYDKMYHAIPNVYIFLH